MKKLQLLVCLMLFASFFNMDAQINTVSTTNDVVMEENETLKTLEIMTFSDDLSYQLNILNFSSSTFSGGLSFRLEDELYANEDYILWQEVNFLDLNFNYAINAVNFSLSIENILNFNDRDFAIAPDVFDNNAVFIQEDDFLISASISYNF